MNINGPLIKVMNHQELLNPALPSVLQILFAGKVCWMMSFVQKMWIV